MTFSKKYGSNVLHYATNILLKVKKHDILPQIKEEIHRIMKAKSKMATKADLKKMAADDRKEDKKMMKSAMKRKKK